MRLANKTTHQSVTLPTELAAKVRALGRVRGLDFDRMLVQLIEKGIEAEQRKQQQVFFGLANRFRKSVDADESKRLGVRLGRMIFGN
ncbi:MAG TPA: hypothetical protein VFF95_08645 [Candidatus Binatus sp.]|nr:hypothetical protein [Candidatus Binatus sp.]